MNKAKMGLKENVSYQLKDAKGNVKPLFKANKLYTFLMEKGLRRDLTVAGLFGNWTEKLVISNLITTAGVAGIAARINGTGTPAAFTYIALGTGTAAAADADTQLEAEITTSGGARAAATCSVTTTDALDDTAVLIKTFAFTSGGTFAVTESGVLNGASTGTLLARQVFSAINVASGDSLQVTWQFDVDTA
jgi:hypothetical protein